jgi:hypothetical protein
MTYTIRDIITNPLDAYREFHDRIKREGANAPFPEFRPAVMEIVNAINSERFALVFEMHPDLLLERAEMMTLFSHLNLEFFYDDPEGIHPYDIPFSAPYPYRPTLEAIEDGLRLLDKLNRFEPGNRAVPFYHFDRYAYHKFALFANPDAIVMPVCEELSFNDLWRVRSVPIGFVGVIPATMRVDRHWQSPLDFWYHDINHVRRMCEYFRLRIRDRDVTGDESAIDAYYSEMDQFLVDKVVPAITEDDSMTLAERAVRRMVQVLVFEVVHESAMTAEPDVLVRELLRPGGPQPFEHMIVSQDKKVENIEDLRTPTGNVASGASVVGASADVPTMIRYFFDRSLGLLATAYNKMNYGFYDDPDHPSDMVVPVDYRTPECMIDALHRIWSICDVSIADRPSDEHLRDLILSREGSTEKFTYKGVLVDEEAENPSTGTYATDPMPTRSVIKEVLKLGKQVCVLMGYSALGYEHSDDMLASVRQILSSLNPEEYCICVGATEEGIGGAYEIAKEMGFETLGIVSTLAMTYTGKYSRFVDRIYIINDTQWGGYIPGTRLAAHTTRAFLEVADIIYAIGGGQNTVAVLEIGAVQYADTPTYFIPAEMNHLRGARAKVADYAGPADAVAKRLRLTRGVCSG